MRKQPVSCRREAVLLRGNAEGARTVIDPYARVNERIRSRRRAQGRRDTEYEPLVRAASQELGAATEAAIGLIVDVAERIGLRYLEEAARMGATRRFRWAPDAVRGVRFASARLPAASGRAVSTSSELAIRTGLSVLRDLRRGLEKTRRGAGPGEGGPGRRAKAPTAGTRRSTPRKPSAPRPDRPRRRPTGGPTGTPREAGGG